MSDLLPSEDGCVDQTTVRHQTTHGRHIQRPAGCCFSFSFTTHLGDARCLLSSPGFPASVFHSNFTAVPFQFFSNPTILHKAYPRNKTLIANISILRVFPPFRELNTCSVC
jgi:hypothetical protein